MPRVPAAKSRAGLGLTQVRHAGAGELLELLQRPEPLGPVERDAALVVAQDAAATAEQKRLPHPIAGDVPLEIEAGAVLRLVADALAKRHDLWPVVRKCLDIAAGLAQQRLVEIDHRRRYEERDAVDVAALPDGVHDGRRIAERVRAAVSGNEGREWAGKFLVDKHAQQVQSLETQIRHLVHQRRAQDLLRCVLVLLGRIAEGDPDVGVRLHETVGDPLMDLLIVAARKGELDVERD
jgi:hypothetical protein